MSGTDASDREAPMHRQTPNAPAPTECPCVTCLHAAGVSIWWMVVCEECGNKRCPHATSHHYPCTKSNAPGQLGSRYAETPDAHDAARGATERDFPCCEVVGEGSDAQKAREARYAEAVRDVQIANGGRIRYTELIARAVMAVAGAEQAGLKAEVERLTRWKSEATEVILGLQDLGRALELPLGERITGEVAAEAARTLKAEVERLREDVAEYDGILSRQGDLLTRTVNALKGDPPPLTTWSHHDVPELAEQMATDVQNLLQDKGTISALVTQNRVRAEAAEAALASEREAHAGLRARLKEALAVADSLIDYSHPIEDEGGNCAYDGVPADECGVRLIRRALDEPAAPVAAEEGGEHESSEAMCGRDLGDLAVCRCLLPRGHKGMHQCKHAYRAPSGSDEQGNRPATPDANGVHDTKGGGE